MKNEKSGQTMIEAMFALGIIIICLVSLITVVVYAVRNAKFANNSSLANQYALEGLEQARAARDQANRWSDFNVSYHPSCQTIGIFLRCIVNTAVSSDKNLITVTVSWNEARKQYQVVLKTYLTKWSK